MTTANPNARVANRRRLWTGLMMAAPLTLLLVTLFLYPVGQLLLLSFQDRQGFSLSNYERLFASSVYVDVLLITLRISFFTALLAVIAGYPIAYLISIIGKERRTRLLFWVLLSFWTSFLVRGFAWVVLLGRNGVVNHLLMTLGITDAPASLLYNFGSVLVGMVHAMMPLAILTMLSVMDNIDRNLTRAAATLGARPGTAFWKVYFPLSLPGVSAGAILVFVTAIGFFILPALLGGRRETVITQIIIEQVIQTLNWGFAGAVSVLLLLVVFVVFAIYNRLLGFSTMTGASAGSASAAPTPHKRGWSYRLGDAVLTALGTASDMLIALAPRRRSRKREADAPPRALQFTVWGLLFLMSIPAFLMIPLSFGAGGLNWPPQGFTLRWYEQVFNSPIWTQAFTRSLTVGIGTGILAMAVGTPVAFLLVRSNMRGKGLLMAFVLSPIVVPNIIIAVGLFYLYARLGLVGTSIGLILGHTVITIPYVIITLTSVLRNYDIRLDLAAQSLGANRVATLRHVTFPILGTGMLSSFLFAFAISFDELTIALFSSGGLSATLPKQFWDEVTMQVSPMIAAVSTCLFLFIGGLIFIAELLRRRSAAR